MSSMRSVLCGRTILRSKQMSVVVMMRNIVTTTTPTTSNSQQSFDLSVKNHKCCNKNQLLSLSDKSVVYNARSKYTTALSNMTKDQANELVFRLNDSERQILLQVLNQFESNKERKRLEVDTLNEVIVCDDSGFDELPNVNYLADFHSVTYEEVPNVEIIYEDHTNTNPFPLEMDPFVDVPQETRSRFNLDGATGRAVLSDFSHVENRSNARSNPSKRKHDQVFEDDKENCQVGMKGELAASRWRSRFGRPAKMRVLGDVDPTGSYCPVPEDWLKKHLVESTPPPTTNELVKLVIINSLPFIGFGFLDNFTMIIAGDYIEHSIGCVITISTMAAAALGNTISDVLGIGSAYYVERLAEKVGIRPPELTPIQLEMNACRRASNIGRVLGITIGCLLGMCPLLFMRGDEKAEKPTDVTVSATPDDETIITNDEKT